MANQTKCIYTCTTCNTCDSCQSFCQTGGQSVGSFSFGACVSKGEIIGRNGTKYFNRDKWNSLITYINNAYSKGSKVSGGSSGVSAATSDFVHHTSFNNVIDALKGLGGSPGNSLPSHKDKDNVIYGSYYENIESYANGLQYKSTQCNKCNVGCNECNIAQTTSC